MLNPQQIQELAPDETASVAARKIAEPRLWQLTGFSGGALWGQFQGSGLYQIKIDLTQFGYQCSCPSRKFPCKHVLGLLFLASTHPLEAEASLPEWVSSWLEKRLVRQAKQEKHEAKKPVDEKAQQKRAEQRLERVQAGLEVFETWLADLIRQGLAGLETRGAGLWEEQARRLVDAQAPGLAARVRKWAEIPASGKDWPARLLAELGKAQLLIEAFRRLDTLEPALAFDVKQMIGWSITSAELEKTGETVADDWLVIGQMHEDDDRLRVRRTWCWGRESRRMALVLQFAPGRQPFAENLLPGSLIRGSMVFYPGGARQRGQLFKQEEAPVAFTQPLTGWPHWEAFLEEVTQLLALQPWISTFGCSLEAARVTLQGEKWWILDAQGKALPLAGRDYWPLLAWTGGEPCTLTGEWDGREFRPLGCWHQGRYQVLGV